MSKRQTERDARSERPTFTGIIRVHWLQSTRALSQMAQATIHLLFWFICWYITERATAASSYFLFALAVHHNLHLDSLVERKDSHTHTHIYGYIKGSHGVQMFHAAALHFNTSTLSLTRPVDAVWLLVINTVKIVPIQIFFVMLQLQSSV